MVVPVTALTGVAGSRVTAWLVKAATSGLPPLCLSLLPVAGTV